MWCNYKVWFEEDGSELVTAITEHCKEVQEMHGFSLADENLVKSVSNNCSRLLCFLTQFFRNYYSGS